jgi:hypothetical protein
VSGSPRRNEATNATEASDAAPPQVAKDEDERAKRPFSNTRADSPQAKGERARQSAPLRVSVPPPDTGNSISRWLMVSLVIAALIMGGRWYLQSRALKAAAAPTERTPTTANVAAEAAPRATPLAADAPAAPTNVAVPPSASADPTPANEAPPTATAPAANEAATAAPTPSESSAPAPAASAPADGTRTVVVKTSPPTARLFRKGKPIGASPVTIELAPGEKRSYEVGAPGWVTRRLVVDGTKPEIFIGLKPE